MGELALTALVPHPPIIVPAVGGEDAAPARATVESMKGLARAFREAGVESIVIISPHSTLFSDAIVLRRGARHDGDLAQFRAARVRMSFAGDDELAEAICDEARRLGAPAYVGGARRLDHGITVPMYFIGQELPDVRLVPVSMGLGPADQLYAFGMGVAAAVERIGGRRVAVVASGDLSHRLKADGPCGLSPRGRDSMKLVDALKRMDVEAIAGLDSSLAEERASAGSGPS